MSKIEFDKIGERLYETGVDHVVLYDYDNGVYKGGEPWNGVTSINENKSGAEPSPLYADNIKYLVLKSVEEYGLALECFTYPKSFEKCNGVAQLAKGVTIGQQTRKRFGLSFRTLIGNDLVGEDFGYKLHLVYGCDASPSEEGHNTVNESPEAKSMSYEITTTPVAVKDAKNTSCVTIDSTECDKDKLAALEKILYGDEENEPRLPLPEEIAQIFAEG